MSSEVTFEPSPGEVRRWTRDWLTSRATPEQTAWLRAHPLDHAEAIARLLLAELREIPKEEIPKTRAQALIDSLIDVLLTGAQTFRKAT